MFGEGSGGESLIDFINAVICPDDPVVQVQYLVSEQLGETDEDRRPVFDIYCTSQKGDHFIVEVQNVNRGSYTDRMLFYSSFPVRYQGKKGKWGYELRPTYVISILNFILPDANPDDMYHEVKLMDTRTQKIFSDKLTFIYLEMPKFRKKENELNARADQWFYVLTNLAAMREIPLFLQDDPVFKRFFMDAKLAAQRELELMQYYASKKEEWDRNAIRNAGRDEGIALATETFVMYLLQNTTHTLDEIAGLVNVTPAFVERVNARMQELKK